MSKELIFSGVQPTGNLHLGNYLGAIKQWADLQNKYECMFCIVDMHAITVQQNPKELLESTRKTAAAYIACGINPEDNIIYNQSAVSGHAELAWILSCFTPLGWLNRMTQFKEKAGKHKENAVLGLYSYPVLMASDILLYKATHVPVGEDQKQHLELARDIAQKFNHDTKTETFPLPEPLIMGVATRVMSLRDGTKKMSKSDESEYSRISMTDSADTIAQKIRKSKSDSIMGFETLEGRPEALNLLTIYAVLSGITVKKAQERFISSGFAGLKKELAELAVATLSPISQKINELQKDKTYLDGIIKAGAEKAAEISEENIKEIKEVMGFLSFQH